MSSADSANGAFVVIVGPDGSGKTTLASELIDTVACPTRYFHFRPPLRGRFDVRPGESRAPIVKMPARGRADLVLGWFRLVRSATICNLSYWLRIRPEMRRGALVVADRWIFGYLTQPGPLRFHGPRWLASAMIRLIPRPSLVVNLAADPETLRDRKQELTVEQIEHELAATAELPIASMITLSATRPPDELREAVLGLLHWIPSKAVPDGIQQS